MIINKPEFRLGRPSWRTPCLCHNWADELVESRITSTYRSTFHMPFLTCEFSPYLIHMSRLEMELVVESLIFLLVYVYADFSLFESPEGMLRQVSSLPRDAEAISTSVAPSLAHTFCLLLTPELASGNKSSGPSAGVTEACLSWTATLFVPFLCGHFHVTFKAS